MVLSQLNELEGMPYFIGKLWIYTFQYNYKCITIPFLALIMTKTVVKGQNWQIEIFLF